MVNLALLIDSWFYHVKILWFDHYHGKAWFAYRSWFNHFQILWFDHCHGKACFMSVNLCLLYKKASLFQFDGTSIFSQMKWLYGLLRWQHCCLKVNTNKYIIKKFNISLWLKLYKKWAMYQVNINYRMDFEFSISLFYSIFSYERSIHIIWYNCNVLDQFEVQQKVWHNKTCFTRIIK